MSETIKFYRENAQSFFDETKGVDMTSLYEPFLRHISAGGLILDAGCGSGRDAKAFLERGFRVRPFDACPELATRASEYLEGRSPVEVRTFNEVREEHCYDGVWACASLLHVPEAQLPDAIARLWNSLKPGGAFYASFRYGKGERISDGRHFTDADELQVQQWFERLPALDTRHCWTTLDQRPGRSDVWINIIGTRRRFEFKSLVTGGHRPFLPHLLEATARSSEIDLAVAFVKCSGLGLLLPDLHSAIVDRAARVRILTSDYLDVTDPEALRSLMLLQEAGAQIRVYESKEGSFHLKAYLFSWFDSTGQLSGRAFVGSSNITRQALQGGLEWNYAVDYPCQPGFLEAQSRFEELFRHPRSAPLTDGWIQAYEARRVAPTRAIAPGTQDTVTVPSPTKVQAGALAALASTRAEGFKRGLVTMATGLGKTWLAAFDATAFGAKRVLFVAHREEIIYQAAATFLRIKPRSAVGFYIGGNRDVGVDVLCASIQTLGRRSSLDRFPADHFDFIVVDEFHHASAPSYQRLLRHFQPAFLLGLTATPHRTDQADILSLCDDNLVFTFHLFEGVSEGLLAKFHYYGIYDEGVEYSEIPWRNGRFDFEELEARLATQARAAHALKEWQGRGGQKTLAFCVSIRHADFMAEQFRNAGVRSAAVHGRSETSRGQALDGLADGSLQVLFSVDLFNEGVDLPQIDTVMLLRPTESKVLFLQQIGRGLRLAPGKEHLVILDFVGNDERFLHKPQALFGVGTSYRELAAFVRQLESGRLELPPGCEVNYDLRLIDFLKSLGAGDPENEYHELRATIGRRPTMLEFYNYDESLDRGRRMERMLRIRQRYGSWAELLRSMDDLNGLDTYSAFLRELETTPMVRCFKMVLLEAFQELDGWSEGPTLPQLAARSWEILRRRRSLLADLPEEQNQLMDGDSSDWRAYWRKNPVQAWIGGNRPNSPSYFRIADGCFVAAFAASMAEREEFVSLVQEIVDYRLASYEARREEGPRSAGIVSIDDASHRRVRLPYFPSLQIACGHFKTGSHEVVEYLFVSASLGSLDQDRHFVARAAGNSMNYGRNPVQDGDYLLMEHVTPTSAGSITGSVMAVETQDQAGDNQYLLRVVQKRQGGRYVLQAKNPEYSPIVVSGQEFRTLARLKSILRPEDVAIDESSQQ